MNAINKNILENYEFDNLIFNKDSIYYVIGELKNLFNEYGDDRVFIARKFDKNLKLGEQEYKIIEEPLTDTRGFGVYYTYNIKEIN